MSTWFHSNCFVVNDRESLVAELDPSNAGVLIVHLDGGENARGRTLNPDDMTRRLEKDEQCIIM